MPRASFALAALFAVLLLPAPSLAAPDILRTKLSNTSEYDIDNDPQGPSGGDQSGSKGELLKGGEVVGRFVTGCRAAAANVGICEGSFWFSGRGQIYAAGRFRGDAERNQIPILGGTREFKGAGGQLTVSRVSDPGLTRLVFRFSR